MAANASPRGQRAAILGASFTSSKASSWLSIAARPAVKGERASALAELAGMFGRRRTVSEVVFRTRCSECGAAGAVAWLATAPVLNRRIRPRRVALIGPGVPD